MRFGKFDNLLHFEDLSKFDSLFHFTTTISGGVSEGNYTSFNLGMYCGDDIDHVAENREQLARMLNVDEEDIIVPHQTHEDKILVVDESFLSKTDLEKLQLQNGVDALITNQKNVCIGVTTADCVPILIYDPIENIFAAIHAGWKGTVARIAEKTVERMIDIFGCDPNNMSAGIAPCISQERFEVGEEVVQAFVSNGFPIDKIGKRNTATSKIHIDLQLANKLLLIESGIIPENIEVSSLCTYNNPDKFFSARRQTIHSGRMLTGGVLK